MDTSSLDIFPQIAISIAIVAAIFFIYLVIEQMYRAYLSYGNARIVVYPYTGSSSRSIVFKQDPNNTANKTLPVSENQLSGIEFSYSTFLFISEDSDDGTGTKSWKSVFYKGYESSPFPLLGPGVFVSSGETEPTLRIMMNTYDKWFNKLDIKNIPINKWFHLAIVVRSGSLDAYVNGNLANKLSLKGTLPYQNYQPLILFPNRNTLMADFTGPLRGVPSGESFYITGKFSGYISNMIYFTYALTYSEIQAQLNVGPSDKFDEQSMDKPPYLMDSWWTQRK